MKKLFGFLRKRWFLTLVGVLALSILVWFIGPYFGFAGSYPLEEAPPRWIAVGCLFGIWALYQAGTAIAARLRNRRMMDQLAGTTEPQPDSAETASAEELKVLSERFDGAVDVLKKSGLKHRLGGVYIYQLPWYLIIGPPGCGKTTALVNSGLRFPLAERFGQDPIRGVGGTRNCDWWFTEEAVLLDTAGRYTTQDSYEAVDSAAWQGFLKLLKKHRPRRPVNGVLVAVSLDDLMRQTDTERAIHARAIRQRVQELHQHLGIRFPMYVLFMKSDLFAGFMEFFSELDREERAQVWGITFEMDESSGAGPGIEAFAREIDRLEERINEHLLPRINRERDLRKRALIFAFPQQFASLKETADRFLRDVFQPSRYEQNPLVRGVYFTSGTQTGAPIDRVMSALAANLGLGGQSLPAFTGSGKSFFITRLLRDVIFREAGLAGTDLRLERHRRWLQRGAYAAAIGVTLIAAATWLTSFTRNRTYVSEVAEQTRAIESQIQELRPNEREPLRFLPVLDALRDIPGGYGDDEVPFAVGFGLSQYDKLGQAARDSYRTTLEKTLLSVVILRLEDQIRGLFSEPEKLHEALRVYLMLYDDEHYDSDIIRTWANGYWRHNWPREIPEEEREDLQEHLAALFGEEPPAYRPHEIDEALVGQAREILNRTLPAEVIFKRLEQTGVGDKFDDFIVSLAAGHSADQVFKRKSGKMLTTTGIPALYTYDGYHQRFDERVLMLITELENERWIRGADLPLREKAALLDEVRTLYLDEYIARWRELLDDLALADARDAREAAAILGLLADKRDSPLLLLLQAIARETDLERRPEEEAGLIEKAGDLVERGAARVGKLWDEVEQLPARRKRPPEHVVSDAFSEIHALVDTEGDRVPEIETILGKLHPLYVYMNGYADRVGKGSRLLDFAKQENTDADAVILAAQALPAPLGGWLTVIAEDSASMVSGEMKSELNRLWKDDVLTFCQQATHDRYPFRPRASLSIPVKDFRQLFGPQGELDAFFQEHFASSVDTSQDPWRWVGDGQGISAQALKQFRLAAIIRESFFAGGGPNLEIEFKLLARDMDKSAKQFRLDLQGQQVVYKHEAERSWMLKWPVPEAADRVRISFVDQYDQEVPVTKRGPWAWFRVLDLASLQEINDELFRVTFSLEGFSATFDLDALSVRNPFGLKELRSFRCPERL